MDADVARLWRKLLDFSLDTPGAADPFSARLARENGWPTTYARRVIHEYKRFVLLAAASGHAVSPSDAVDQAWHLHLTYTRSYWQALCAGLLGRPLHHVPSDGTATDREKHRNDYANTLASYERLFAERAPRDIWPPLARRFGKDNASRRVLCARHWIIAKPRAWRELVSARGSFAASPWLLFGMIACLMAVWSLTGPQYLVFHLVFSGAALAAAILVRRRLLRGPSNPVELEPLDAYQVAYLRGGAELAIECAVMGLVGRGALSFDPDQALLLRRGEAPHPAHPLELGVYESVQREGSSPAAVYHDNMPRARAIADRLRELGLLSRRSPLPVVLALAPVAFGVLKIALGMLRDKPVAGLVLFCVVQTFVALFFLPRWAGPTSAGKSVIAGLRARGFCAGAARATRSERRPGAHRVERGHGARAVRRQCLCGYRAGSAVERVAARASQG